MPFKDARDFLAGPLHLPYNGKTYTVAPITWPTALKIDAFRRGDLDTFKDETDILHEVLGAAVVAEMVADGVPASVIQRAYATVVADRDGGREFAEMVWEAGLDPEALAAKKAAHLTTSSSPKTSSLSSAAENATRSLVSSSGTNSHPGTPPRAESKKRRSKSR